MALPTPQQVRDLSFSGQFAALSDAVISRAIAEAALHYVTLGSQPEYEQIVGLHAAHILAVGLVAEAGGGQGPVTSESLGPASRSFAVQAVQVGAGVDTTTSYGRRLQGLLRTLLPTVRTPRPVPFY